MNRLLQRRLKMIYADDQFKSKKSTVLFKEDWHKGIIGIVASRCIERHYKPTVILTESDNKITGSARSVDGFDIYQALEKCSDHLIQFGGTQVCCRIDNAERKRF